jgi:hypothetical protein
LNVPASAACTQTASSFASAAVSPLASVVDVAGVMAPAALAASAMAMQMARRVRGMDQVNAKSGSAS